MTADQDFEQWRLGFVRSARRVISLAIVAEIMLIVFLIKTGSWQMTPTIFMTVIVLCGSRWLLSDRGQAWLRMMRGEDG